MSWCAKLHELVCETTWAGVRIYMRRDSVKTCIARSNCSMVIWCTNNKPIIKSRSQSDAINTWTWVHNLVHKVHTYETEQTYMDQTCKLRNNRFNRTTVLNSIKLRIQCTQWRFLQLYYQSNIKILTANIETSEKKHFHGGWPWDKCDRTWGHPSSGLKPTDWPCPLSLPSWLLFYPSCVGLFRLVRNLSVQKVQISHASQQLTKWASEKVTQQVSEGSSFLRL